MADGEVLALAQEMTVSRDAFLRSLPSAVGYTEFRIHGDDIRSLDPQQKWRIVISPLADLRLGMLALPRQQVTIFLAGYDADKTERFLARFELYFRRSGG